MISQFTWVDQQMTSDLLATSFYKPELQPANWVAPGFSRFELITVKSPLIHSNQVEEWMLLPFFQELLLDQYFLHYQPTYEE